MALYNQKRKHDSMTGKVKEGKKSFENQKKIASMKSVNTGERITKKINVKQQLNKSEDSIKILELDQKQNDYSDKQDIQQRRNSFTPELLLHREKIENLCQISSNIFEYSLPTLQVPSSPIILTRSLSDSAIGLTSCSAIPKNYRYTIKDFKFVKAVNSGSFGKICLVQMISTGELYAMKIINSEVALATNREDYIESEWNVFRQINCEHIVRCYYTFNYSKYLCFVMEYLNGGDLSFYLDKYFLTEKVKNILLN